MHDMNQRSDVAARLIRHLLLPLMAPVALIALYFTPKTVFGCYNRGLMAIAIVLTAAICALASTWRGVLKRNRGDMEGALWWLLTTLILLSPILLLFGPLA